MKRHVRSITRRQMNPIEVEKINEKGKRDRRPPHFNARRPSLKHAVAKNLEDRIEKG